MFAHFSEKGLSYLSVTYLTVELLPYVINQQLKSSTHVTKMFKQVPWKVKGAQTMPLSAFY